MTEPKTPPTRESSREPSISSSNIYVRCEPADERLFFSPSSECIDPRILESDANFVDQELTSPGVGRIADTTKRDRENQVELGPSPQVSPNQPSRKKKSRARKKDDEILEETREAREIEQYLQGERASGHKETEVIDEDAPARRVKNKGGRKAGQRPATVFDASNNIIEAAGLRFPRQFLLYDKSLPKAERRREGGVARDDESDGSVNGKDYNEWSNRRRGKATARALSEEKKQEISTRKVEKTHVHRNDHPIASDKDLLKTGADATMTHAKRNSHYPEVWSKKGIIQSKYQYLLFITKRAGSDEYVWTDDTRRRFISRDLDKFENALLHPEVYNSKGVVRKRRSKAVIPDREPEDKTKGRFVKKSDETQKQSISIEDIENMSELNRTTLLYRILLKGEGKESSFTRMNPARAGLEQYALEVLTSHQATMELRKNTAAESHEWTRELEAELDDAIKAKDEAQDNYQGLIRRVMRQQHRINQLHEEGSLSDDLYEKIRGKSRRPTHHRDTNVDADDEPSSDGTPEEH